MCVKDISEFFSQLPSSYIKDENKTFYRGQSNKKDKLLPSILRDLHIYENEIYTEIMTECAHDFNGIISQGEILSKMQHYGVPTRLLDITSNPLVALYFACEMNFDIDGVVYVFTPTNYKNIKAFDSDSVSILACLPRFNEDEKNEILNHVNCLSDKEEISDDDINEFNNQKIIKRLLHEIKKEKPAFDNVINPKDLTKNYIFIPQKNNARIIRQSGAFIIYGLNNELSIPRTTSDTYKDYDFNTYKIIINGDSKKSIKDHLSWYGISKATLYPELYKVAEFIKEKYKKR